MANFAGEIARKGQQKVVLYRARSRAGEYFFAYIRCNEKQHFRMKQDFETQSSTTDVKEYGEVLYTAPGREPDDAAKAFLEAYLKAM